MEKHEKPAGMAGFCVGVLYLYECWGGVNVRFKGEVDKSFAVLFVVITVFLLISLLPMALPALEGDFDDGGTLVFVSFFVVVGIVTVGVVIFAPFARSYIELRDDEVLIAQGLFTKKLPYRFITSVEKKRDAINTQGWAASLQALLIKSDVEDVLVSVVDEAGFIAELSRRCPRIAERSN